MGRIVDRTGMLEKLLKKSTQNNIRFVFYGGENSSIRNAMMLLNRDFDSCEWHEHLNEDEIICDDNIVYIVSADADDGRGADKEVSDTASILCTGVGADVGVSSDRRRQIREGADHLFL